jgi:ribosomal protein L30E
MSENIIKEIKTALENGKIILGTKRTLKNKNITKIIVASNIPEELKKEINKKKDVEIIKVKENNKELGETCKKPFNVSVIGISK